MCNEATTMSFESLFGEPERITTDGFLFSLLDSSNIKQVIESSIELLARQDVDANHYAQHSPTPADSFMIVIMYDYKISLEIRSNSDIDQMLLNIEAARKGLIANHIEPYLKNRIIRRLVY